MPSFSLFALEDTSMQVCWTGVAAGPVHLIARWPGGMTAVDAVGDGGPGAAVIDGLPPGTTVTVDGPGGSVRGTTLVAPPGRELSRFATINDMHIGARWFGARFPIWDDDPYDPAPVRCLRAALEEARAWGADALLVKGDLTQRGRPGEWEQVAELLAGCGLATLIMEGNHETKRGSVDGRTIMARYGLDLVVGRAGCLDLPGVRIIAAPTARWHVGSGWIDRRVHEETVALLASLPERFGAVVALHHYPQRFRYPTIYPIGMSGPHARRFLDDVAAAHPATLVVAGHSHRHRRHDHGPLTLAETGSTKDFPGSWAGYRVFEGGILQTTRRVMEPSAIRWTEGSRWALGGVWGMWSPGMRSHRCFSAVWA